MTTTLLMKDPKTPQKIIFCDRQGKEMLVIDTAKRTIDVPAGVAVSDAAAAVLETLRRDFFGG
jgi:hypothetical protein